MLRRFVSASQVIAAVSPFRSASTSPAIAEQVDQVFQANRAIFADDMLIDEIPLSNAAAAIVTAKKNPIRAKRPLVVEKEVVVEANEAAAAPAEEFSQQQILSFVTIVKDALTAKDQSIATLRSVTEEQKVALAETRKTMESLKSQAAQVPKLAREVAEKSKLVAATKSELSAVQKEKAALEKAVSAANDANLDLEVKNVYARQAEKSSQAKIVKVEKLVTFLRSEVERVGQKAMEEEWRLYQFRKKVAVEMSKRDRTSDKSIASLKKQLRVKEEILSAVRARLLQRNNYFATYRANSEKSLQAVRRLLAERRRAQKK